MSTVEALGIPKENIRGAPIEVYDFSSNCQIHFCRNGMGQSQLQRWTFQESDRVPGCFCTDDISRSSGQTIDS